MSCPIKFNFEGYPSLKAVQAYYGANLTSLTRVINTISKIDSEGNRIPSESFAKWYKDHYGENVDFKTENANTLKNRILEYYQLNLPSVTNNYRRENNTDNPVVIYGYESANARKDAKDSIISMILAMQRDSKFGLDVSDSYKRSHKTINEERYWRARYIVKSILLKSKLKANVKSRVISEIIKATNEGEVRAILANYGLKANFDIYSKNNKYIQNQVKKNIRNILYKKNYISQKHRNN